ncbi:methyltransferase domain-containing protein [Isoptericola cucumis]|uniref:class I SAM-dependent methyltransferase n=1 Tax=Isoptericola cucumis TaxID=1776856 RepID=UPI003208F891
MTAHRSHDAAPDGVRMLDDVRPGEQGKAFLPGMGKAWLMPLYDPMTRALGVRRLHRRTVEAAGVSPGQHVLDVGTGTGSLAFAVLRAVPDAVVTGLDPDAGALRTAARKARRRRYARTADLTLVRGYADRLPLPDASLDHVVSSLALHHVPMAEKQSMAAELMRVLRPGGWVTIADFDGHGHGGGTGHGHGHDAHAQGHRHGHDADRHGHGHGHDAPAGGYRDDAADDGIPRLLAAAGMVDAREVGRTTLLGGTVLLVRARRP